MNVAPVSQKEVVRIQEKTNLIPVRGGGYWVLCSQRYTTGSYDQQDGHFKIPQIHHIVTRSTNPGGGGMLDNS